jgi:hypothetical protein
MAGNVFINEVLAADPKHNNHGNGVKTAKQKYILHSF